MVFVMLVDSNIWIFANMDNYPEHKSANSALKGLASDDLVATNALVLSEVYHKLSLMRPHDEAEASIASILGSPAVRYLPITKEVFAKGARLARSVSLRINDAVIAAQALEEGASVLTDNVRDFRKVPKLKVVPLGR